MQEIYLSDGEYRQNWFDNVVKQIPSIVGEFHRRYLKGKRITTPTNIYVNMELPDVSIIVIPLIKIYKGKKGGASTFNKDENMLRINLNGIESEGEFVSDVVHEVIHYILDILFEEKLNYKNNHHNMWFWILYADAMSFFGLEDRHA